jgi:hypothetical protein
MVIPPLVDVPVWFAGQASRGQVRVPACHNLKDCILLLGKNLADGAFSGTTAI